MIGKILYNKNKIHKKKNLEIFENDAWFSKEIKKKTYPVSIERNQINFLFHWNICTQLLQYEKRSRVNPLKREFQFHWSTKSCFSGMGPHWPHFQLKVRDSVTSSRYRPRHDISMNCIAILRGGKWRRCIVHGIEIYRSVTLGPGCEAGDRKVQLALLWRKGLSLSQTIT